MREALDFSYDNDIRLGSTTKGPHRDDLRFDLGGVDLRKFGSQGQQRTAALSLKLSEVTMMENWTRKFHKNSANRRKGNFEAKNR